MRIKPIEMTKEIMERLEQINLIIRLTPDAHRFDLREGEAEGRKIYSSDIKNGSHKLISVVINSPDFFGFGTHSDNEEFLLLGSNDDKPLYLLISLLKADELEEKIGNGTLTQDDFVCLKCRFNDPELSFFTMLKGVPHGEATCSGDGAPPKFYVTEPDGLKIDPIDISGCDIVVE